MTVEYESWHDFDAELSGNYSWHWSKIVENPAAKLWGWKLLEALDLEPLTKAFQNLRGNVCFEYVHSYHLTSVDVDRGTMQIEGYSTRTCCFHGSIWLHVLFVYLLFLFENCFWFWTFSKWEAPVRILCSKYRVEALDLILEKMKADNFPFDKATACGFASGSLVRST